jgi:hypothetical protein
MRKLIGGFCDYANTPNDFINTSPHIHDPASSQPCWLTSGVQTTALGKHLLLGDRVLEKLTLLDQEIPRLLCNPMFHRHLQQNPPMHCSPHPHTLSVLRNILILSLHLRLQQRVSFRVSELNEQSSHFAHRGRPSHAPRWSSPNNISWRVKIQKLLVT